MNKLTKINDEIKNELEEHLLKLNKKYNKNCILRVTLNPSSQNSHHININLDSSDPLFTLYHEFGHCLQDNKKSMQNKVMAIKLMNLLIYIFILLWVSISVMGKELPLIIGEGIVILLILGIIYNFPLKYSKRIKKANHLIELRCDRFAARQLKRLPYGHENFYSNKDSFSHPSSKVRIESIGRVLHF